jgi:hypothetical protein
MDAGWQRLRAPEFWNWLFCDEVAFEEARSFELPLACDNGHGIRASVHEGVSITLSDLETGTELGWLDDAHAHPNCLRAQEVLYLARMRPSPERQHLATLLLLPFAVIASDGDDAPGLEPAALRAWEALGFEGRCPGLWIPRFHTEKVEWHLDVLGRWCLRQPSADLSVRPLSSLRVAENPDFPAWLSRVSEANSE